MQVEYFEFQKELDRLKSVPPLLLLIGNEDTFITESAKKFETHYQKLFGSEMNAFNIEHYYGNKDSGAQIMEGCGTLPLMAQMKIVVVHGFDELSNADFELVEEYCENPNTSTCLVLLWNIKGGTVSLSQGLPSLAARQGLLVKCWELRGEDLRIKWMKSRVKEMGKDCSFDALMLLSKEGGTDYDLS